MKRPDIDDKTLAVESEFVGLPLPPARREVLVPVVNMMVLPALRALADVDVGDTPPAHTFDPRWRVAS